MENPLPSNDHIVMTSHRGRGENVPDAGAQTPLDAVPGHGIAELLRNRQAHPREIPLIREDLQRETRLRETAPFACPDEIRPLLQRLNPYADRRFRPLERRLARTLRPPTVDLRAKKP